MSELLLYNELSRYYELIYSWKNYEKEVEKINKIISEYKKSPGNKLLEVGCGNGRHLKYLKNYFECTGVDINNGILNLAGESLHDVEFIHADMISLDLGKKFDVITCLFSSIGYVQTYENLEKTIKNFSEHLNTGGVVIIEPWFTKSAYKVGSPHMNTYSDDDTKISRLCVSKIKDNISIMDMHYLIAEKNKRVSHFIDRHEMGLFETDKTLQLMEKSGLKSVFTTEGLMEERGLFVGIK